MQIGKIEQLTTEPAPLAGIIKIGTGTGPGLRGPDDSADRIKALEAELTQARAIADEWESMLTGAEAERDALAAQVAALVSFIRSERDTVAIAFGGGAATRYDDAITNLPAAAAALLAKVAEGATLREERNSALDTVAFLADENATLAAMRKALEAQRIAAVVMVADWSHGEDCPLRYHDWDGDNNPIGDDGKPLTGEDCDCGLIELQDALSKSE